MGLPNNYSLDVPNRCLDLLNSLLPEVRRNSAQMVRHKGALTTTLTLALATPMLSLPIERIEKHLDLGTDEAYADDRHLDPRSARRIEEAIRGKRLGDYPEFGNLGWRFVQAVPKFNIARGLPELIAKQLADTKANTDAMEMEFQLFLRCLRNALSHGGIIYLDEDGRTTGNEAKMLCFVSARPERSKQICDQREGPCPSHQPKIKDLRLLRIDEESFQGFLHRWVSWLNDRDLQNLTAA
jgi:hypothetical protein